MLSLLSIFKLSILNGGIDLSLMSGAMDKAKKEINMKNRAKQFRFLSFPLTPVSYTWEKHAFFVLCPCHSSIVFGGVEGRKSFILFLAK